MNSSSAFNLKNLDLFYGNENGKIKIYRSEIHGTTFQLFAKRTGTRSKCPSCMKCSGCVRSHYVRTLADMPLAENTVHVKLKVRRFACKNTVCKSCFKPLKKISTTHLLL